MDTFGVPEFYSDAVGAVEDAGYQNIRLVRGVMRNGIFQPVVCLVAPALSVMQASRQVQELALQVMSGRSGRYEAH